MHSGSTGRAAEAHYDHELRLWWVPVSPELLDQLAKEWSEPVQIKIVDGQMTARRPE
jgi:hypothetical protein